MKRVLSLVLALVLVLGMIPTAFAADATGAQHLYDHGFITGKDGATVDAKLDVNAKLTRAQLAALIAELNGAKEEAAAFAQPADFADADTFQDWAKPFIAYAQQNEWMNGFTDDTFRPDAEVPAQQLAAVLLNALGYDFEWANALQVAADLGIVVSGDALTRGEAFEAMWTAVSEVPMNTEEGLTLGVFLGKLEPEVPVVVTPELVVKAVNVLNPKQIEVVFGDSVDPDTVIDANGAIINSTVKIDNLATGFTGEFNDDNTVLTLTKDATNWTKDQVYVVSVQGVKNDQAKAVPAFAVALKMVDTTAPDLVTLKSVTNQLITRNVTLVFSEPVSFTSIKVNGKFVSAVTADSGFGAVWTLTTTEDLDAGSTYTVEINNLKDLFNNLAAANVSASVTIVRDNVKPLVVSVTPVNETKIAVKFDKTMSATVGVDSFIVTKVDPSGNTIVLTQSGIATRSSVNKDTFYVNLASAPFDTSSQTTKDIKVTVKGLSDSVGNTMDSVSNTITITRDTVKPAITSVVQKPGTQNILVVTFSERVTLANGSAVDASAFTLRNSDGSATTNPTVTITGVSAITSSNTVELTLSAPFGASAAYNLVLIQNALKDTANVANYNGAQVVLFNFTKDASVVTQMVATINTTGTTVGGAATVNSTTNKKVEIVFDQTVVESINPATGTYKTGAADDPANYTVDGVALPSGTVVTVTGGLTVTLDFSAVAASKLPNAFINGGTLSVGVSNVASTAGSTVQYTTAAVTVVDTTKPVMSAAYLQGSKLTSYTFTLQMSEAMNAADIDDFTIETSTPAAVTMTDPSVSIAVNSNNNTQVVITVLAGAEADKIFAALASGTITVKTIATPTGTLDKATVANALTGNTTGVTVVKYTSN
ncbi:MAG: hypothetical protein BGO41_09790 [Clostridiales bacterium 38-18]|nr:MAG: hypothetical protein BGO41_09790 [Clostridiales bacterium 38-18]